MKTSISVLIFSEQIAFNIFSNFPLKALNISTFYIAYVSTQTFHLLIFLLAAERFVLFFFPHTEKSILILWKKLKIWHIYAAVIVKEVACFMDAIYELYRSSGTDSLRIVTVYGVRVCSTVHFEKKLSDHLRSSERSPTCLCTSICSNYVSHTKVYSFGVGTNKQTT